MRKIVFLFLMVAGFGSLLAQKNVSDASKPLAGNMPVETWGLGAVLETGGNNLGFTFGYAISKNFQVGAEFGFYIVGSTEQAGVKTEGYSVYNFTPYAKYMFSQSRNYVPFLQGSFEIGKLMAGGAGKNSTVLKIAGGMDWYPTSSFGLTAGVNLFQYDLDVSQLNLGIGQPFIGIMWWM